MWSLRVLAPILLLVPAAASADDRPAAEKPFGLERRIPWNDSRVVGSPDPLPPYKVVRAFPKLTVKQPLSLTPEPGTNRLFILQHLNFWAGPGRLLAVRDDQDATEAETLLEIDGLAVGVAFHPDYERNGYLYIGLNGPMRRPDEDDPGRALHGRPPAAAPHRPGVEAPDHRVALQRPRRRRPRLRQRRLSLRLLGGRLQRLRRQPDRPDPRRPAGGRAADRRRSPRPGPELRRAEGQPVRRSPGRPARAVGLRPAQPLAAELRPRVGPALGRPEWAGPLGAGLPDQEGGQLRLEPHRGEPHLPRPAPGRSRPDLAADRRALTTARPARSPAAGSTAAPACPSWSGPTSTATGPPAASGGSSTTARRPSGTASWSIRPSTSPASAPTTPASCTSSTR